MKKLNLIGKTKALYLFAVFILSISHVNAQNCTVNAGVPRDFCDNETVKLTGSFAGLIKSGTNINWSQISGPAAIISLPEQEETDVLGTSPNTSLTFRLSATCEDGSFVYQDVTHTVLPITEANAGPDQEVCPGTYNLAANPLTPGETGTWSISGANSISINDVNDPNSAFTAIEGRSGAATLTWTITSTNGCTSTDEVIIRAC